jgi:hypothetical protein
VIINGRREDVLRTTAEELNAAAKESQMGGEVIPVQGDVATKQGIVEFYDKCTKHLDKVCQPQVWGALMSSSTSWSTMLDSPVIGKFRLRW